MTSGQTFSTWIRHVFFTSQIIFWRLFCKPKSFGVTMWIRVPVLVEDGCAVAVHRRVAADELACVAVPQLTKHAGRRVAVECSVPVKAIIQ